jgi:hypothetical protein
VEFSVFQRTGRNVLPSLEILKRPTGSPGQPFSSSRLLKWQTQENVISSYACSCANVFYVCALPFYAFFSFFRLA